MLRISLVLAFACTMTCTPAPTATIDDEAVFDIIIQPYRETAHGAIWIDAFVQTWRPAMHRTHHFSFTRPTYVFDVCERLRHVCAKIWLDLELDERSSASSPAVGHCAAVGRRVFGDHRLPDSAEREATCRSALEDLPAEDVDWEDAQRVVEHASRVRCFMSCMRAELTPAKARCMEVAVKRVIDAMAQELGGQLSPTTDPSELERCSRIPSQGNENELADGCFAICGLAPSTLR